MEVDGRQLKHLKLADDIVLITNSTEQVSRILHELHIEELRLMVNMSKTKFMRNEFAGGDPVLFEGAPLQKVEDYVYLGRLLNMKNHLRPEISRRKRAAWAAYNPVRSVVENCSDYELRANIFNSKVLPALCYGCETWTVTKAAEDQLRGVQAALERNMVGISLHLQHNEQIQAMSRVREVILHIDEEKQHFTGHFMRRKDERWSTATVH